MSESGLDLTQQSNEDKPTGNSVSLVLMALSSPEVVYHGHSRDLSLNIN